MDVSENEDDYFKSSSGLEEKSSEHYLSEVSSQIIFSNI